MTQNSVYVKIGNNLIIVGMINRFENVKIKDVADVAGVAGVAGVAKGEAVMKDAAGILKYILNIL